MTHYTSCNGAGGVLWVCAGEKHSWGECFRCRNCPCLKGCNQSSCCWMNIMELTFHPSWTYVVLLRGSRWIAEHNNGTDNRTKYITLPQYGLALRSKDIQYAHRPDRCNSFRPIFCESHLQMCIGWKLPCPASKVEDALYCWGLFLTYNLSNLVEGSDCWSVPEEC